MIKIKGEIFYLWRAVDQHGDVLDVLVQKRRDKRAAKRFLVKLVKAYGCDPRVMITDKLRSYGAAKKEVMPDVDHRQHKGLNNRAEASHKPTRRRERVMQRFKSPHHAQRFCAAHDGDSVYKIVRCYQADAASTIIVPPRRTATPSDNVDGPTERDRHIKMIHEHGRMAWQKATDYGRRSLVETAFGRYKSIIGDSLSARDDDAQMIEAAIRIKALNRMTRAAKQMSGRA